MIRVSILFIQVALLVFVSVWLANEPGTVTIVWRNWQIEPPIGVLILIVAAVGFSAALAYRLWRFLRRAPANLMTAHRTNRERRGYRALSEGMLSLAAGDSADALKQARRADALLSQSAAGHLIIAQAAASAGNTALARKHYEAMSEDESAAAAGMKGLFEQAIVSGENAEALRLALRIREIKPDAVWILPQLFELQVAAEDWVSADQTISEAIKRRAIPPESGKRRRSLVLYERGRQAREIGDQDTALGFLREAHDLEPTLVVPTVEYAQLLHVQGKHRRAMRILEQCWVRTRHPEVARVYVSVSAEEAPMTQLKLLQKLTSGGAEDIAGAYLLAEFSLRADLWGEARRHLDAIFKVRPTDTAYRLMAELLEAENGDTSAAESWRAQALSATSSPAWLCDNCAAIHEAWPTVCDKCGAFDSIHWAIPQQAGLPRQLADDSKVPLLTNSSE